MDGLDPETIEGDYNESYYHWMNMWDKVEIDCRFTDYYPNRKDMIKNLSESLEENQRDFNKKLTEK